MVFITVEGVDIDIEVRVALTIKLIWVVSNSNRQAESVLERLNHLEQLMDTASVLDN